MWTIPNIVSIVRLGLLPLFAVLLLTGEIVPAIVTLAVLGASDWVDGWLARRLNQVSLLGKRLDPLADRLCIVGVGAAMAFSGLLPWVVVAVILACDVTLSIHIWQLFRRVPNLRVSLVGRMRTGLLLLALPLLLIAEASPSLAWARPVGLVILTLGTIGHVIAAVGYALAGRRKAAKLRRGTPGPDTPPS